MPMLVIWQEKQNNLKKMMRVRDVVRDVNEIKK